MKIGQLAVYFGMFDDAMPVGFRQTREEYAAGVGQMLSSYGTVVYPGLVHDLPSAEQARDFLASEQVDAIVFAPTMAAPPAWAMTALESRDVPVVVLGAQESGSVPDDYNTETATARSLPVGLVMLTNVLVRRGRPFTAAVGELGSPELDRSLGRAMRAAAAVAAIRGRPIALVGEPMEGYDDVLASPQDLERLGVQTTSVAPAALSAMFAAVPEERTQAVVAEMRATADTSAVPDEVLQRSCRLSAALEDLCDRWDVGGGTVNCHGPLLRWSPEIGITACLGVSRLSQQGVPFSCTGDVPTAIALVLGKAIAGSALYCELYQMDLIDNWILIANGGEGDLSARAPGSAPRLLPEDHYSGQCGPGTAVAFELPEGQATLMSLTPADSAKGGWILVSAEGEIVGSKHRGMEGPNGMFRFASHSVATAYQRWCQAGATHHAVLLAGARQAELQCVVDLLGIELVAV